MVEVVVVWGKLQVTVVKLEVVEVEVAVVGILVLSTKLHFPEKPRLLPLRYSKEVKLVGYI